MYIGRFWSIIIESSNVMLVYCWYNIVHMDIEISNFPVYCTRIQNINPISERSTGDNTDIRLYLPVPVM